MLRRDFTKLLAAAAGLPVLAETQRSAARRYIQRIRRDLEWVRSEQADAICEGGERLAERVAAGGALLVFDRRGAYAAEAMGRAGGLMAIGRVTDAAAVNGADAVIIVSDAAADEADVSFARAAGEVGAATVAICPVRAGGNALAAACDIAIDNYVTDGDAAIDVAGMGAPIGPTSGVLNTAILWALTAAYIEAMEKRGTPPTVWMSIKRPGAAEFNEAAQERARRAGY